MALRQIGIQPDGLLRIGESLAKTLLGRKDAALPTRQRVVRVSQPGMGEGILRVASDGLLEAFNRASGPDGPPFPIVAALEIQAVCLRIFSVSLQERHRHFALQTRTKLVHNDSRHLVLSVEYVGDLAVVPFRP